MEKASLKGKMRGAPKVEDYRLKSVCFDVKLTSRHMMVSIDC